MYSVLLVDDFAEYLDLLSEYLTYAGWECATAASASEALALLASNPRYDVVVIDLMMKGGSGVPVILESQRLGIPAVVATALPVETASRACPANVVVVSKPFDLAEFENTLRHLVSSCGLIPTQQNCHLS